MKIILAAENKVIFTSDDGEEDRLLGCVCFLLEQCACSFHCLPLDTGGANMICCSYDALLKMLGSLDVKLPIDVRKQATKDLLVKAVMLKKVSHLNENSELPH